MEGGSRTSITKDQSGSYTAVDIHYKRVACAPHQNVINYLDHLHIMVIHKSLTAYLGCSYSRVLVGPLGNNEMSDFLSFTLQNKYEIEYTMYLKKTNTTAVANSIMLDDMYCIGTYQGSEKMNNYLVFCDELPKDDDVRETLLSFKIPKDMQVQNDPVQNVIRWDLLHICERMYSCNRTEYEKQGFFRERISVNVR